MKKKMYFYYILNKTEVSKWNEDTFKFSAPYLYSYEDAFHQREAGYLILPVEIDPCITSTFYWN